MLATVLTLLFATTATPTTPENGQLCISVPTASVTDGTCRAVSGTTFEIAPASNERLFLWTAPNAKTVQIGVVPAAATTLDLESDDRREVKIALQGDRSRGWPLDAQVSVRGKVPWRFSLPARDAVRMERLLVPAGQYGLEVRAEHHRPIRARIDVTRGAQNLSAIKLEPLPRVRGKVVGPEQKAIGYSTVTLPDGSLCATADEQGVFTCELPERTPELVAVHASGYGTRELKVDRTRSDIDLGTIQMSKGEALTVRITRDDVDAIPTKVTLFSDVPDEYDHTRLRSEDLEADQDRVTLDDLSPGRYLVVVSGKETLERLTVAVDVKSNEENITEAAIEPYRLEGTFFFGDEPATRGTIEMIDQERGWRERVAVAADGTFGGTMWQKGELTAFAAAEPGMSELVRSPALGSDPSRWEIRIRNRAIVGKIIDAKSGDPVSRASVHLVAKFDGAGKSAGQLSASITVQPDSSFRILASRAGKYQMTVNAPGYVSKIVDAIVGSDDATKAVEIAMDTGVARLLEIVSSSGAPIPNVMILEGVRNEVNPQFMLQSDAEGKHNLRGTPGETRVLYLIPSDGSFAVARIQMPRDNQAAEPLRIIVPPVAGSLRVRAVDAEEQPAGARILVRYNGEFVPPAMLRFITNGVLGTDRTGEALLARLPAGSYEVWGVGSFADEQQLIASQGSLRPAARVGLSAGEQTITITAPFIAKSRRESAP